MRKNVLGCIAGWVLALAASTVYAGDCQRCHATFAESYMQPALPAVRISDAGGLDEISLAQLYGEHGHPCVGTGIAFRALRYGLVALYGDTVPRRDDLLVLAQIAGPGVTEAIDRIVQGPAATRKTVPLPGMRLARDNFLFSLYRKSTGEMVTVRFKPELLPADFFPLKARMKKQGLTPAEWQVLHGYIQQSVGLVIRETDAYLFDVTSSRPQLIWGLQERQGVDGSETVGAQPTSEGA